MKSGSQTLATVQDVLLLHDRVLSCSWEKHMTGDDVVSPYQSNSDVISRHERDILVILGKAMQEEEIGES